MTLPVINIVNPYSLCMTVVGKDPPGEDPRDKILPGQDPLDQILPNFLVYLSNPFVIKTNSFVPNYEKDFIGERKHFEPGRTNVFQKILHSFNLRRYLKVSLFLQTMSSVFLLLFTNAMAID